MINAKFFSLANGFLILFFGLSFYASSTLAQNKVQKEFLARAKERPTALELMATPGALDAIENANATFDQNRQMAIIKGLPKLIASLEKSYPGAIIGFLGRDTSLLANATEAVYARYGYTDRVRFIDLSTPIFLKMKPQQMAQYLVQLGVSDQKGAARPFVMVDYTSLNTGSQSTQLIAALTRHLLNQGLSAEEIIARFNVLTLKNHTQALAALNATGAEIQAFKEKQVEEIKKAQTIQSILKLDGEYQIMAYSNEWHNKFDNLTTDPHGQIKPVPSQEFPEATRLNALAEQIALIQSVQADVYLARMEHKLEKYGVHLEPSPTRKASFAGEMKKSRKLLEAEFAVERKAERQAFQDLKRQQHEIIASVSKQYQHLMDQASTATDPQDRNIISPFFTTWWNTYNTLQYRKMNAEALHEITVGYLFRIYNSGWIDREELKSNLFSILIQIDDKGGDVPVAVAEILKSHVSLVSQFSLEQIEESSDLAALLQLKKILNKSLVQTWVISQYELDYLNSSLAEKRKQLEKAKSIQKKLLAKNRLYHKRQRFLSAREMKARLTEYEATLPVHPLADGMGTNPDFNYLSIERVNSISERAHAYQEHFTEAFNSLGSRDYPASQEISLVSLIRLFEARKFTIMDLIVCADPQMHLISGTSANVPQSLRPILKAHSQISELLTRFVIHYYYTSSRDPSRIWPTLESRGFTEIQSPDALKRLKREVEDFKVTYQQEQRKIHLEREQAEAQAKRDQYLQGRETGRAFQEFVDSLSPLNPTEPILRTPRQSMDPRGNGNLFSERGSRFLDLFEKHGGKPWQNIVQSPLDEITFSALFKLYSQKKIDSVELRGVFRAMGVFYIGFGTYSNNVKKILITNSDAVQVIFRGLFQDAQNADELRILKDRYNSLAQDLSLTALDRARLALEKERAEKRLKQLVKQKKAIQYQANREKADARFSTQKSLVDEIRNLKDSLPVLDLERDVPTSLGQTQLTDGMQLSENAQDFARIYDNATESQVAKDNNLKNNEVLFTVSASTLISLYDQNKLTDSDLTSLFEVVLFPKIASPNPDLESLKNIWRANRTSRAVELLFGAPRVRKAFSKKVGTNSSFQENKSADGKMHVHYRSKLDRLKDIYKGFIKENEIAPSCRFIYR